MEISYRILGTSPTEEWLELLNSSLVRKHLIQHPQFTVETLGDWLDSKATEDQRPGCRLREISCSGQLAGWCGIQFESGAFEAVLVLSPAYWGRGREVVSEIRKWANEMGHNQLLAHFPHSRPQAKALTRLFGQPVGVSNIKEHVFVTYRIKI
ncbi:GNAT family N-acetyltransferase [Marinobacter salarius]|uniref:GNAT family N-acetyltransferase n=1 Tax=Marinobacter salarius TaxID=1420917 RepID=UPI003D1088A0